MGRRGLVLLLSFFCVALGQETPSQQRRAPTEKEIIDLVNRSFTFWQKLSMIISYSLEVLSCLSLSYLSLSLVSLSRLSLSSLSRVSLSLVSLSCLSLSVAQLLSMTSLCKSLNSPFSFYYVYNIYTLRLSLFLYVSLSSPLLSHTYIPIICIKQKLAKELWEFMIYYPSSSIFFFLLGVLLTLAIAGRCRQEHYIAAAWRTDATVGCSLREPPSLLLLCSPAPFPPIFSYRLLYGLPFFFFFLSPSLCPPTSPLFRLFQKIQGPPP